MHQDTEVLILNFPLGEDRVCWCYLNHSLNLVIDECRVNRSIKLLQSTTERTLYRVTETARGSSVFLLAVLPAHEFAGPRWGYVYSWKFNKDSIQGFSILCLYWHSCVILKWFSLQNKACRFHKLSLCSWIFMQCPFAKETHCIRVWTVMREAHFSQLLLWKCCLLTPGLLWRGNESAPEKRFKLQSHQQQLSEMNLIKVNDSSAFWDESGLPWRETFPRDHHAMNGG